MQSATEYLARTETAVRLLFEGIGEYVGILERAPVAVFVTSQPYGPAHDAEYSQWRSENADQIAAAREAEREYLAESFALDTLCGSLLQVATKAIQLYGHNTVVPPGLPPTVTERHAKFCVGRSIRSVPLGLILYAARNQHTHFGENKLGELNSSIFRMLATKHGYGGDKEIVDPAFDLGNTRLVSYASNVTALIGWRAYDRYVDDMRSMLGA